MDDRVSFVTDLSEDLFLLAKLEDRENIVPYEQVSMSAIADGYTETIHKAPKNRALRSGERRAH